MKEWFSASELAGLPGLPGTDRGVRKAADRDGWKSRKRLKGKGSEYHLSSLPAETQAHLLLQHKPAIELPELSERELRNARRRQPMTEAQRRSLWAAHARKPGSVKEHGKRNLEAIQLYFRLCAEANAARDAGQPYTPRSRIESIVADQFGVSVPSIRNWKARVQWEHPSDWWAILTPNYVGRTATAEITPEAWDWFKADYLRPEAPAAKACYNRLLRVAKEHAWIVPDIRTLERRIKKEIPRAVLVLARQGQDALKRLYPAQERDRSVFHALEAVNADGHKFDVFVRWPDGEIGRPMMCAWQDIYSGKLLAWRIDKTENSDSIRLSFGDLVENYGIPGEAFLDNGRGFASKWMTGGAPTRFRFKVKKEEPTGIMTTLGVRIHWATPYHGQAKPIERAFRDLCEYIAKHPACSGAYTGNNPTAKPENYGSRAMPIDKFIALVKSEIKAHNARTGRTGGLTNGRSFDQVFNESYARATIRKATEEQRGLWLLAAESVTVRQDGSLHMRFDKRNRYWDEMLEDHAGQKVIVRFDPQHLHKPVHVYTLANSFICTAICLEAEGFNDVQAAREHGRNLKRFMRATKERLEAERRMSVLEAAAMMPDIPDAEVPDAKVVRIHKPDIDIPMPKPTELTDEEREAAAEIRREMEAESSPLAMFGRDPARDFALWERLDARKRAGEILADDEFQIWESYQLTDEFEVLRDMRREFAAEAGAND